MSIASRVEQGFKLQSERRLKALQQNHVVRLFHIHVMRPFEVDAFWA